MNEINSPIFKNLHKKRLMHSTYFSLRDRTPSSCEAFADACTKYLSIRRGITGFWVGTLSDDLRRKVNDLNYDVAMHIEFENFAAWDAYSNDPDHMEFVKVVGNASSSRRVFDSYLDDDDD
jgi:hypothetical protein